MNQQISDAIKTIVVVGIAIIVGVVGIGAFASKLLVRNLKKTMKGLDVLSKGDLTVEFQTKTQDEFGKLDQALNYFTETLRKTVGKNISAIQDFDYISQSLNQSSQEISCCTTEVESKASQIADVLITQQQTIEFMQVTINGFSQLLSGMQNKASDVEKSNQEILKASEIGNTDLQDLLLAMNEVTSTFYDGTKRIDKLNDNVHKITKITVVINGVAKQTNLLALNAAIEAARAGEAIKTSILKELDMVEQFGIIDSQINNISE